MATILNMSQILQALEKSGDDNEAQRFHHRVEMARDIIERSLDMHSLLRDDRHEAIVLSAWSIAEKFMTMVEQQWEDGREERRARRDQQQKEIEKIEQMDRHKEEMETVIKPMKSEDPSQSHLEVVFKRHTCQDQGVVATLWHAYTRHPDGRLCGWDLTTGEHWLTIEEAFDFLKEHGWTVVESESLQ